MEMMSKNWRDLIRPKRSRSRKQLAERRYGKFVASRSSAASASRSATRFVASPRVDPGQRDHGARIEGALHEFTHIPEHRRGRDRHRAEPEGGADQADTARTSPVRIRRAASRDRIGRATSRSRRDGRGPQPRPRHRDPVNDGWQAREHGAHVDDGQGLRPGRGEQAGRVAGRHDRAGRDLLARSGGSTTA
jgi:hypothetical protein